MWIAVKGMLMDTNEYVKKDTGEVVKMVSVASGKYMLGVKVSDFSHLIVNSWVMVFGQLSVFGRELSVKDAIVRPWSERDDEFLDGFLAGGAAAEAGKVKAA